MTDKKYLITRMNGRIYSFLLHDQKAIEIHCDDEQTEYVLGNIYIGKIKNIAKNIGAAFVEIVPGMVCHLALDDMKCPVYTKKGSSKTPQTGDELLVQIAREGIKTKHPSVTTKLTLYGKYVLLTLGKHQNSVSSKLTKEEKRRLLAVADDFENSDKQAYSWLFRTNAGDADAALLHRDMEQLRDRYEKLMAHAQYRTCFSCLHAMPPAYLLRLLNLYDSEAEKIMTDDTDLYEEMREYLTLHQPEDVSKLALYQDTMLPMQKLYSLEHQLSQALHEKVWLNSGGYLVIQTTEALTVIDVNTGKYEGGKKREAAFLKINREAAVEIARQLRLRNLSGIIIVDFINMEEEASKKELLSLLDGELRKDPIRTTLVDMTKLSLVEITRMKKEKPLAEYC